jgi:hypothetical protein
MIPKIRGLVPYDRTIHAANIGGKKENVMNDPLRKLLETARSAKISEAEKETQRRSFAYGNTHFENSLISREMVDQAAEELKKNSQK